MDVATLADDLLEGAEEIRAFMGWDKVRRVYYAYEMGRLPIWREDDGRGSSRLISSKSALRRHYENKAKQAAPA